MNLNLSSFLKTFFQEYQCEVLSESKDHLHVQLTETLDQVLMNRPFYWQYIKSTRQTGKPMTLYLTTQPNQAIADREFVHFGSPRFLQIVNHLKRHHSFIKGYETIDSGQGATLFPWLLTNIKISYKGLLLKEEMFSLGLNLVNGFMRVNMMESLARLNLKRNISDYCHTISPLITLENGYRRIEKVLLNYIYEHDQGWSELALERMKRELEMVHYFFSKQAKENLYEMEKKKIYERFKPKITMETISGGIVYLTENFHKNVE